MLWSLHLNVRAICKASLQISIGFGQLIQMRKDMPQEYVLQTLPHLQSTLHELHRLRAAINGASRAIDSFLDMRAELAHRRVFIPTSIFQVEVVCAPVEYWNARLARAADAIKSTEDALRRELS